MLSNLLYRPYSQRSFLCQLIEWLKQKKTDVVCEYNPHITCFKKFDIRTQRYTDEIDYDIIDHCTAGIACQFLRTATVKYLSDENISCTVIQKFCSMTDKSFNFCQTNDETQILRNFLLLTGTEHYPMLIPQPSILSGQKRPDFICFVPITKFQYQPVVVLVDRSGKDEKLIEVENNLYADKGYLVKRILVDKTNADFSYFKSARELKNWIERP